MLKKISLYLLKYLYLLLVKIGLIKPSVIIRVDGGICSQMHQYLLGYHFMKKGYKVTFDNWWFDFHGTDLFKQQVRNFDLTKAFPYLNYNLADNFTLKLYRYFFHYEGTYPKSMSTDWMAFTPPVLMQGYYADSPILFNNYFPVVFKSTLNVLDAENLAVYKEIDRNKSIAVHVRRGDLSTENPTYGIPATVDYFIKAIILLKTRFEIKSIYFFSDGHDYVKKEIQPRLNFPLEVNLVENGSDKGYMDLILMSRCKYVITSKGTLGKYAALLDLQSPKIVTVIRDDKQTHMLDVPNIEKVVI